MNFSQCFDKIVLGWKYRRCRDEHDHDLSGRKSAPDQHMTQKPILCIFIVRFDFKRFQKSSDRDDDLICFLILDHAGVHRNNLVCAFLVNTGNRIASAVTVKHSMHFIAVMIRIFHSDDRMYFSKRIQKDPHTFLFVLQLFCIRHSLKFTSAAFFATGQTAAFLFCFFP